MTALKDVATESLLRLLLQSQDCNRRRKLAYLCSGYYAEEEKLEQRTRNGWEKRRV